MNDIPGELLLLAIPLVVLQVGLTILGLWDLTRPGRHVRGDSRLVWGLIIVFVNILGPLIYFAVGREEREDRPNAPRPERRRHDRTRWRAGPPRAR